MYEVLGVFAALRETRGPPDAWHGMAVARPSEVRQMVFVIKV